MRTNNTKLKEILSNKLIHSNFLDKESVEESLIDSYNLGVEDVIKWLSNMTHLCDNIPYIIEEWKNQNKNG